jgi:hypothetical protein
MPLPLRAAAVVIFAGVAVAVTMALPSRASCGSDNGPQGSSIIFAGSAQEDRRGYTRFSVTEVWTGPDLAPEVWVRSGQEQPPWPFGLLQGVSSSGDVQFPVGAPYIVGATHDFRTDACSVEPAGPASDDLRPQQVRSPVADGRTGIDPPVGAGEAALRFGTLAVVAGLAVMLYGKRRRRAS